MLKTFFITGTDTGVGKTYVTCAIARSLRSLNVPVGIYKPVCSGAVDGPSGKTWDDVEQARIALGGQVDRDLISPQRFLAPLAPSVAARCEGRNVDEQLLLEGFQNWKKQLQGQGVLLVEGAGGWLSPLSDHWTCADFARQLGAPVVIVAAQKLGVINHTLLTLASVRSQGLVPAAVVLNSVSRQSDASASTNSGEISRRGAFPNLHQLAFDGALPTGLIEKFLD